MKKPHFVVRLRDTATQNRLLVAYDARARQIGTVVLPPDPETVWRGVATPEEFEAATVSETELEHLRRNP